MKQKKMNTIREEKAKLRKSLLQERLTIPTAQKALLDRQIIDNIVNTNYYKQSSCVIIYAATRGEIDLFPLFHKAVSDSKKAAFPRCFEGRKMKFFEVSDINQLKTGNFGILEPELNLPQHEIKESDLCIVPAIAYDKGGYRLGYGGGFYDAFLADFACVSAGAVYSSLLLKKLPREQTDMNVNIIITEKGVVTHRE